MCETDTQSERVCMYFIVLCRIKKNGNERERDGRRDDEKSVHYMCRIIKCLWIGMCQAF